MNYSEPIDEYIKAAKDLMTQLSKQLLQDMNSGEKEFEDSKAQKTVKRMTQLVEYNCWLLDQKYQVNHYQEHLSIEMQKLMEDKFDEING